MVVELNQQIVLSEGMCAADEERLLCVVRDLIDASNCQKQTVNLPVSTPLSQAMVEFSRICGYVADTVSYHYENKGVEVVLERLEDSPLGQVCPPGQKRYNFTLQELEDKQPQKLEIAECSAIDNQSSGNSYMASGGEINNYATSTNYSDYNSYSYASALIKSDTGYIGLVNQAMTCYLNSLLQTLFMTPEFRNAIYRWEFDGNDDEAVKSIPYQLQRLFLQLQTSKKRAVETTDLTKSFGWDSSEVWQQHDVQELCRVMFDALEQRWKHTDQANLINQLYQGKLKDYVKCLECGYESARTDAYLDIPLVIRPFGSTRAYGSVEEALEAFVQPETLDGTNQYFCERCNKKCDAHKGLKIVTFPYLLTLQLKRFDFDYSTMHRIKLNDRMTFPEILDLNRFVAGGDPARVPEVLPEKPAPNGPSIETAEEGEGAELQNGLSGASGASSSCASPCNSSSEAAANSTGTEGAANSAVTEAASNSTTEAAALTEASSNSSSEAATNDKNARESACQGPYVYELFSIMVHSGSAAGGHYYAYIKSFKDGQWYSFNDQQVTRITYDDIRKTYGGSSLGRGFYSSTYASSANAYMFMYRQIDKEKNADFMQPEDFPDALKKELQRLQSREEAERKQREIDKSTCKIKLYCFHPVTMRRLDMKFEIHKDRTLREATEMAYKLFELESYVSLDCCRLVKYDEYTESLEKSYDGEEETSMATLLGGVKTSYTFDLLLETRKPDQVFQEYKPGGVTIKLFIVDIYEETIQGPISIRAYHVQTVEEFKALVAQQLDLPEVGEMRCVLERFHNDLRLLQNPHKTLKAEGFFKSNKVFIEYSNDAEDIQLPFQQSRFYQLLDRHQNTIRVSVSLPSREEVVEYLKSRYLRSAADGSAPGSAATLPLAVTVPGEGDGDGGEMESTLASLSLGEGGGTLEGGSSCGELSGQCSDTSPSAQLSSSSSVSQDAASEFALAAAGTAAVDPDGEGHPTAPASPEGPGGPFPPAGTVVGSGGGSGWRPLSDASLEASDFSDSNQSRPISSGSLETSVGDLCNFLGGMSGEGDGSGDTVAASTDGFQCEAAGGKMSRPLSSGSMETHPGDDGYPTDSAYLGSGGDGSLGTCNLNQSAVPSPKDGRAENLELPELATEQTAVAADSDYCSLCRSSLTTSRNEISEPSAGQEEGEENGEGEEASVPSLLDVNLPVQSLETCAVSGENWDVEVGESAASAGQPQPREGEEDAEADVPRYFTAVYLDSANSQSQPRTLIVLVDKRITLGAFKKRLEEFVGAPSDDFKVFRVYSNNQEFESIRLSDSLSFLEDGKLNIKMGRALRPGEHRVKVYQLLVNEAEPCRFLIETIFAKGMTVLESKKMILPEIRDQCGLDIPLDRCRLRKKTWKNPGTIYIDSQVYEDEIALFPNWEVFLEVLDGPEQMTVMSQLAVYVRRWRPSTYTFDSFQEVVLQHQKVEELKQAISKLSGIPVENVDFAKGKGTFPCDISVLEISSDLEWNPQVSTMNVWPLYICDDGHVIFYKDRLEELGELSEEMKKEIQQKESVRLNKTTQKLSYSPRKERALKIYTDDSPPSSSTNSYADVD